VWSCACRVSCRVVFGQSQHYAGSLCALVLLDHLSVTQALNVFLEAQKTLVLSLFDTSSPNASNALPLGNAAHAAHAHDTTRADLWWGDRGFGGADVSAGAVGTERAVPAGHRVFVPLRRHRVRPPGLASHPVPPRARHHEPHRRLFLLIIITTNVRVRCACAASLCACAASVCSVLVCGAQCACAAWWLTIE
jgi:hypothetical protein